MDFSVKAGPCGTVRHGCAAAAAALRQKNKEAALESLLSVTSARLPNVRNMSDAAPSNPCHQECVGRGGLLSDKHVGHVDTFKNLRGAAERLLEFGGGAAQTRQRELLRRDDGIFQSSTTRRITAPRPRSVSHLTIHFSPLSGPSPAKSSDFTEAQL